MTGWASAGQYCTEDVDECQLMPNACQNGGTCHNTHGGYNCVCVNGWTGEDCSENIDDCASAACFHGATCHDRVASFYCECPHGRTGERPGHGGRGCPPPRRVWGVGRGHRGRGTTALGSPGPAWRVQPRSGARLMAFAEGAFPEGRRPGVPGAGLLVTSPPG